MIVKHLMELVKSKSPHIGTSHIAYSDLVFEERVLLNCYHCRRYGVVWTCPPRIPDLDYKKVLMEFENLLLVYCKMPLGEKAMDFVRRESTNILHRTLLEAEKLLWEHDYSLAVSFVGGSCKLCAQGCDPQQCRQPHLARIPLEATGMNVVESAKKVGMEIVFPPKNYIWRVGLLGW